MIQYRKDLTMNTLFTSESVTGGHPDKVCDQVSDGILDALLAQDPYARCACEVTCEPGALHIMGEVTTNASVDYEAVARGIIRDIGYNKPELGFDDTCDITISLHEQSPDIAQGVDLQGDIGAGDQGMMFGFACNETPEGMPLAIVLANRLTSQLTYLRQKKLLPYLRPDGKAQVTLEYRDGSPVRVNTVVVSTQHAPEVHIDQLRADVMEYVIRRQIDSSWLDADTIFHINPTGRFVLGGPAADTGLTGRKIIADTYGGYARHGGGAFSGKDPTKVDRSAAYMARHIAKAVVAHKMADQCEIQLGYAIGVSRPVSISVDTRGTATLPEDEICAWIEEQFDLRPSAIITYLDLRRPIYRQTAAYGHFGRSGADFSWERVPACEKAKISIAI